MKRSKNKINFINFVWFFFLPLVTAILSTSMAVLGSSLFALSVTSYFKMTSIMFPLMMVSRGLLGAANGGCQRKTLWCMVLTLLTFKRKVDMRLSYAVCFFLFFFHFYSCTRSGYCLLVSRQTGIGFWSHSERHQVRKRSKLLYHFKHCKDLWSADGSLDR